MLILNDSDISKLVDPTELTDAMVHAMEVYASGQFNMPDRMHMDMDGNTLLLMPAAIKQIVGIKLVTLYPANPSKNHPTLYGTVILNDGETGQPLALINGAKLTAVRTAAVGAAGVRYTSPEETENLGLIGCGVQGYHQIQFICSQRPIKNVFLLDARPGQAKKFIEELQLVLPEVHFQEAKDATELCFHSEIIVTATNSNDPVLPDNPDSLRNKHIIAIGSYKENMIEIPESLFQLLDKVYVDVDFAIEESGDLIHPLRNGKLKTDQIRLLSELFPATAGTDLRNRTTLYKSVGMALFDLFTGQYLLDKALRMKMGQQVAF